MSDLIMAGFYDPALYKRLLFGQVPTSYPVPDTKSELPARRGSGRPLTPTEKVITPESNVSSSAHGPGIIFSCINPGSWCENCEFQSRCYV